MNDFTINPNDKFDPIQFLEILKKSIELFDTNNGQRQKLYSRIDDIMKGVKEGRTGKAEEKIEQFIKILENNSEESGMEDKINKLFSNNIKMLVVSLNKLLVNLKDDE